MRDSHPEISIIIPVYNNAGDVQRCLDSITNQTYHNWEAICVDDGSTDQSPALLDAMAVLDSRFRVIHQPNGGAAKARNTGLEHVRAPYITMVDADDYLEPDALEQLYAGMKSHSCDIVITGMRRVFKNKPAVESLPSMCEGAYPVHPSHFFSGLHPGPCAKLYKSSIIQQHHIRFPEGVVVGEDLLFNAGLWCHIRSAFVLRKALYNYVESSTSVIDKFLAGELPVSVYESTVRLPYTVYEMVSACQGGVHEMDAWLCKLVTVHFTEQDWAINDARHSWKERCRLRHIAREYYNRMASQLTLSERFQIKLVYYIRWNRGRMYRILGKIKRFLKRILGIIRVNSKNGGI